MLMTVRLGQSAILLTKYFTIIIWLTKKTRTTNPLMLKKEKQQVSVNRYNLKIPFMTLMRTLYPLIFRVFRDST